VNKTERSVRVYANDGGLVAYYPASVGSEEKPAPSGAFEVRAIARNPNYTYNPSINFKQGENDKVLTIPPGPNGPVGSVWIALDKPTYGITNLIGNVMPGIGAKPDLAVIGPMARGVDDLKLALSLIIGPAPGDRIAWTLALPPPRREGVEGLKIAVMLEHPDFPVDSAVKDRIQAVADFLASRKAEIDETARPAFDMRAAFRVFIGLLVMPLVIRRQDEQFWLRLSHLTQYFFGEDGEQNETHLLSHAHWLTLDNARDMVRRAWDEFFKDYDILICPAAPGTAVPHDVEKQWHERRLDVNGKPLSVVEATVWGSLATLGNLPATVAPAGFSPAGLPVGVQIIGPEYGDHACLAVAQYLERHFQGFVAPKGWD